MHTTARRAPTVLRLTPRSAPAASASASASARASARASATRPASAPNCLVDMTVNERRSRPPSKQFPLRRLLYRLRRHPRVRHLAYLLLPLLALLLPYLAFRSYPIPAAPTSAPPHPDSPLPDNHTRLHAPRAARHVLVSSRDRLASPHLPSLRAFLLLPSCHTRALPSLIAQSFPPTHLDIVHVCAPEEFDFLRRHARRIIADSNRAVSSYALRPELSDHPCPSPERFAECALAYIADVTTRENGWAVILDHAVFLEPVALEKAWMSALSRPNVPALRFMRYDHDSLSDAHHKNDPLAAKVVVPNLDPIHPLPLFINVTAYGNAVEQSFRLNDTSADWFPFLQILSDARIIREALYTRVGDEDALSLHPFQHHRDRLPAHLFSELAFYRSSAQRDEQEIYAEEVIGTSDAAMSPTLMFDSIPHWPLNDSSVSHRIFLVLPWMEMGGSEKCMLDIAQRLIDMHWGVTFVLTMPFWQEDALGEIKLTHQWLDRALALSSDTFDLLALAPIQSSTSLLRYLLESRQPDFLLMANSRWAYYHADFIRAVSPKTVIADYNHMIHLMWEGGGMPRFGANYSESFDLHLTASKDVASHMRTWIKPEIMRSDPLKVEPCYIGVDPSILFSDAEKSDVRTRMRAKLDIPETTHVVLFAGRFVIDKGIDVVAKVAQRAAEDPWLANRLTFIFVGSGDEARWLKDIPKTRPDGKPLVIIRPPAVGLAHLRYFYAASDIFMLPSINEGIALVAYEAMAAGLLVITTDVGGQKELVTENTGILLPNYRTVTLMTNHTFDKLKEIVDEPETFETMIESGRDIVRAQFTTEKFCTCVVNNLQRAYKRRQADKSVPQKSPKELPSVLLYETAQGIAIERYHGKWNRQVAKRSLESFVTIGIKTYICDMTIVAQVRALLYSIRDNYPKMRVILANDGPTSIANQSFVGDDPYTNEMILPRDSGISFGRNYMVNQTTTPYFLLLDDDHVFDDLTNLTVLITGIRSDNFDIVGMRVRNLPGIDEYEREGIVIPRYVGMIQKLQDRDLTLCVWNENRGPSIYGIQHPIKMDVLHNAFVGRVEILRKWPWRNELKVNEHMTFFLDAKDAGLKIGYLPSVFVHHRPRDYSECYFKVRFREDRYRTMLRYRDQFLWDMKCQGEFPERVKKHIIDYELDF